MVSKATQIKALSYVKKAIERNKEARKPLEWRWYENAAYAAGFTNVVFDPRRQRPISLDSVSDESSNPQVQDKLRKYHAKLTSPRMMPECIPRGNDREARKRADIANAIILHFWEMRESVYANHASLLNAMVFGNGIWATQWNENAGEWIEEISYREDETPSYDDMEIPQIDEEGLPSIIDLPFEKERRVRTSRWQTGLPKIRSVHPFNFFPDPHWRHLTVDQCMNYAERKLLPLDLIELYYPDLDMDNIPGARSYEDSFLFRELDSSFGLRGDEGTFEESPLVEVWDFYHAPIVSRRHGLDHKRGFRCIHIGDQIIDMTDSLPYNDYPHATFRDRQYTDRGWGLCVTDVLRSAQKRLDLVERIEIRAAERSADPPILVPEGAADVNFQGRPGEIYKYMPYGEEKPTYMIPPEIPRHIYQMRSDAMADIESLSLTASPVGGSTPARGDSAAYLDRLLEENQVAMAPTIQEIETAQGHQAFHLIRLVQDHLPIGYRFAMTGRDKMVSVMEFDGRPFNVLEVRMVPGSAAMTFPNQLRTAVMQLAANGILMDDNPKASAVMELLLGAPAAARLTDLEEPGDKAVAELNVSRILNGQLPFFKSWMNHQKHIESLLSQMRDPRFFLDFTVDQQSKIEQLLAQHQAAIAPNPMTGLEGEMMMPGGPTPGGGPPGQPPSGGPAGEGVRGTQPRGPAQTPAVASGFTGPLGRGAVSMERALGE